MKEKRVSRLRLAMAAGLVASVSTLAAVPAQAADKVSFLTSWYAQAAYGGYYQAKATGIYEKHGLDVTISNGGPQISPTQLVVSGKTDFTTGHTSREMIAVSDQKIPVVMIATPFQFDERCIMAHSDVKSMEDLKGRDMYISSNSNFDWWPWMKDKFGLNDEQIRPYTSNMQPFFANKNAAQQCYISSEPFIAQQNKVDVNVFVLADHGYPAYGSPLITSQDFLKKNPDIVKRFVQASMEGWKSYLEGDPTPANTLIKQDNPNITDDILAYSIEQYKKHKIIMGGDAEKNGIGAMSDERMQKVHDFLLKVGVLKGDSDQWRQSYTTEFIDQAKVLPAQ